MIPRIGRQGKSFKGAAQYYLHDKGALSADRVAHSETRNLPTQDPELGWRVMAATAKDSDRLKLEAGVDRRGRKLTKPVFHLSLSWSPDESPDHEHMVSTMDSALERLGLSGNQGVYVIHNDAPHPHIHAFLNLVNPDNGRSNSVKYSKEKLSQWAEEYERVHGIQCEQRIANNARRSKENRRLEFNRVSGRSDQDKAKFPRYKEKEMWLRDEVTRLYRLSEDGRSFLAAVRELGCEVAQGKRIVLVDADGNTHSLARQLDGVKAAQLRKHLRGIALPKADEVRRAIVEGDGRNTNGDSKQIPTKRSRTRDNVYFDRDAQSRRQDERVIKAGIRHQKEEVRTGLKNRLQDAQLGRWGEFYEDSLQRRQRLDKTIEAQYGSHERRLLKSIAARETKLTTSGLRGWYAKNFTRESERLENDRRTLANIQQRKQEPLDGLARGIDERHKALAETTAREQRALERDLKPAEVDKLARSIESQQRAAADAHARYILDEEGSSSGAFERERKAYLARVSEPAAQPERAEREILIQNDVRPQGPFNAASQGDTQAGAAVDKLTHSIENPPQAAVDAPARHILDEGGSSPGAFELDRKAYLAHVSGPAAQPERTEREVLIQNDAQLQDPFNAASQGNSQSNTPPLPSASGAYDAQKASYLRDVGTGPDRGIAHDPSHGHEAG